MYQILNNINSPQDVKKLNYNELSILSSEIRDYIINVVAENGGHLASNLGVVELSLAMHRVFESPRDKIIWDVGHQAYIHKIITGRREEFTSLRQYGGMSGFPKRCESEHDIFDTGHSSTSISSAFGIAKARDLAGDNYCVTAVIGDGALTGGMAFEAMNHAGNFPTNFMVILNDNEMSISPNVGSLPRYLNKLRTEPAYFRFKEDIEELLNRIPLLGKPIFSIAEKLRDWLKYLLVPGVLFEELGFKYFGPIDGHNISNLEAVLKRAKNYNSYPVLIHVVTKKGKGYSIAESKPEKFHGVVPFDIKTGEAKSKSEKRSYSSIFGEKLVKLAETNNKIVAVSAAMPEGTGLSLFSAKYKDRFFDVGIAEQHAVTFCAGLAVGEYRPIFAVYSTFLQRAYDQIIHDVCMQKLPVVFAVDRAGIVGSDGETHHGVFDISYLRHMPNITIMSPKDGTDLEEMLELAFDMQGPVAIRYPRGSEDIYELPHRPVELGKAELLSEGEDGVIIAEGKMVSTAWEVSKKLKEKGKNFAVVNIRFIKPLDEKLLMDIAAKSYRIFTIEDNVLSGGLGSGILEFYSSVGISKNIRIFAYDDSFITHGECSELYKLKQMDSDSIFERIMEEY